MNKNMKPVMIVENSNNALVNEFVASANKRAYLLGGIFTEFGIKNRNERIYTAEKFLPCLEELNQRISTLAVYGEFDHPDVFDTSLQRASHIIKEAKYNRDLNRVEGKIQLLPTYWGKEALALVESECPVFVSSRAAGVTEADGTVTLKKLFTYDIVADPGFGSARMSSINESLNYSNSTNFRIYDMSEDSKANELFNMNQNDLVTKTQLAEYSDYLIKEINGIKESVTGAIKAGDMDPKKMEKLLEYYENLQTANSQMVKYLDYLADKIQVVVNDNKNLRDISEKLISHNDYLASNLEENINFSEGVSKKLESSIEYSNGLAKNVDRTIQYVEYVAGKVDENVSTVNNLVDYSNYIVENMDKLIAYSNYIAENLDKSIEYSEYIVENFDNSISYIEYLTEHVEGSIAYSEYIAEHLDDAIAYSDYLSNNLDKTISYAGVISEKLNGSKVNEGVSTMSIPTLEEFGFEETEVAEPDVNFIQSNQPIDNLDIPTVDINQAEEPTSEIAPEPIPSSFNLSGMDSEADVVSPVDSAIEPAVVNVTDTQEAPVEEAPVEEAPVEEAPVMKFGESFKESDLSKSIDKLIQETTKRKASETSDLHFLKFLNKAQVDGFYALTNEEQELVKVHMSSNKNYFSTADVLRLVQEALSVKNETMENRIVRLMPDSIKPVWESLNENVKKSIVSQAKLYPNLTNESAIEHFWYTRNLNKPENSSKKMISHDSLIKEDKLSDSEVNSIMERIKGLK